MKALIDVTHSEWIADGERFPAGEQEIELTPKLAPLLAHAVELGAVALVDPSDEQLAALEGHVEPQEVSEANLAEAMGEWIPPVRNEDGTASPGFWTGPWYEGHLAQAELDAARSSAELAVDVEEER